MCHNSLLQFCETRPHFKVLLRTELSKICISNGRGGFENEVVERLMSTQSPNIVIKAEHLVYGNGNGFAVTSTKQCKKNNDVEVGAWFCSFQKPKSR